MGLELIELTMEIEDAFELSMPDEDAAKIGTVGQTAAYVIAQLRQNKPTPLQYCPTARTFHRLRNELRSQLGVARRRVMPSSRIGDLVPSRVRRFEWNEVARACGLLTERGDAFPSPKMTVRELIYTRSAGDGFNREVFYLPNGEVNTRAVWRRLQDIVSKTLDVAPEELKWDTHYVHDLHAG